MVAWINFFRNLAELPAPIKDPGDLGRWGEARAERFLLGKNYRILERNYRHGQLELDLIAEKSGELYFVEVKTRGPKSLTAPAEAIDDRKRAALKRAGRVYIQVFASPKIKCHFLFFGYQVESDGTVVEQVEEIT